MSEEFDFIQKHPSRPYIMIPTDGSMTNGDVIKAIFPLEVWLHMKAREFNKTWWNAPYRSESEEV